MRLTLALVGILLAQPLGAAVRYVVTIEEGPGSGHSARRAYLIDGDRWRIQMLDETDEPRAWSVMLGTGKDEVGIDHARRAWWSQRREQGGRSWSVLPSHREFGPPMSTEARVRKSRVVMTPPQPGPVLGGRESTIHEIRFSASLYAIVGGSGIHADIKAIIRLWSVEGVPPVPALLDLRSVATMNRELEQILQTELATVPGHIVRREIELTRQLDPKYPVTVRSVVSVDAIDLEAASSDSDFTIPAGYVEAPPVIGGPGR
jgi:hypothetical protein